MDIAEIKKRIKRPERDQPVCLSADLVREHARLNDALLEAQREATTQGAKMADQSKVRELAKQVRDLEDRMREETVIFRLRSLSAHELDELMEAHPPREGRSEVINMASAKVPLVAAACVDPAMTVEDAQELCDLAGADQFNALAYAAWGVSTDGSQVPFSLAASVTLGRPEQKSK